MNELHSKEQFNDLIQEKNIIMLFYADWCKDCVFIDPFIQDIIDMFHDYQFVKVDRDKFLDICEAYNVFGIPSFIVFHEGKEIGRFVSKERKTKEEIISFIKNLKK